MKCRINICKSACCHNVPFANNELERFKDKIVTPVLGTVPVGNAVMPITNSEFSPIRMMQYNRCPFLRHDCRCNIYEHRPEVCRLYGQIDKLPCEYRKK